MSQVTRPTQALAMLWCLLVLSLVGCGDNNNHANFDPDKGAHPSDWLPARHAVAAIGHLEDCAPCHGTDFSGGISKVACTQCHLGNQVDVHPLAWDGRDYALHGQWIRQRVAATGIDPGVLITGALATTFPDQARAATQSCATSVCHGTDYRGVPSSGPSCFDDQPGGVDSSCHAGNAFSVHPLSWFPARFTVQAGIAMPTILPAHAPYVQTYGAAECIIPVCHGNGSPPTINVGVGSTRITGTTPTTPNYQNFGYPGFVGFTSGRTQVTVTNTGRLCAACHI
ncbi:cytochrome C [Geomonas agri]|uniref:cytochrome C n=1 Tax=Geomonas agri TaxID=2873702 RepID=UPI001CD5B50C|nr:cytochrome C [Geomonas agri]